MTAPLLIVLLEAAAPLRYWAQCSDLWNRGWGADVRAMVRAAKPVSVEQFVARCDATTFLAEELDGVEAPGPEEVADALRAFMADDAGSGLYASRFQGHPVHFLQSKGFEFVFR